LVEWAFGTEELSGYSEPTRRVEPSPFLWMNDEDAAGRGLREGDRVAISTGDGKLEADLRISSAMARNALILPRHRDLDWQRLEGFRVTMPLSGLRKA
jgi:anaerobic selenocysteine-containing dehydrogenase